MLVLSRRQGEKIVIGNDVVLTVLDVKGEHVKLGVSAPRHIAIHREEIFEDIKKANQQAQAPKLNKDNVDPLRQLSKWAQKTPKKENSSSSGPSSV